MIFDLPDTTTGALNRKLVQLRESGSSGALGRVMTLIIVADDVEAEAALNAANEASREHPCRVLTVARGHRRGATRLDAQIRVGGDAGAAEVIVLRLYGALAAQGDSIITPLLLSDAPVVVWWPGAAPDEPVKDPIGSMSQRRITDAAASRNPIKALQQRARAHVPGDTDLAWTRISRWRAILAAALDQPPYEPVTRVVVSGAPESASSDLLAAWLGQSLGAPVRRRRTPAGSGTVSVVLERASGPVVLSRPDGSVATLEQPGQPERRLAMPKRSDAECLAEELRRLDPDEVFAEVVTKGLPLLGAKQGAAPKAAGTLAGKSVTKAAGTSAGKSATKAARRSATKATGTSDTKATDGSGSTTSSKQAPQAAAKAENKTAAKTAAKTAIKPTGGSAANTSKRAAKAATKATGTSGSKISSKRAPEAAARSAAKTERKAAAKTASKPTGGSAAKTSKRAAKAAARSTEGSGGPPPSALPSGAVAGDGSAAAT